MPSRWAALQKLLGSTSLGQEAENPPGGESSLAERPIHILLVEDDAADAELLREILSKGRPEQFDVTLVGRISEARQHLARERTDVILLDLALPDSRGLHTVEQVHAAARQAPIVVLTGSEDEALAVESILLGAQYYVLKNELNPSLLLRAIRYAMGPERVHEELRNLALRDELTGILNLRGFAILAEQQLKLARRSRRELLLAFFDVDGLKEINDTFGHSEGSRALVETADILRQTFRASDIIGRLGGDEFAGLIMEASENSGELLLQRLQEHLRTRNAAGDGGYRLSLSVGTASYDPRKTCSLHELLARADKQMYEVKKKHAEGFTVVAHGSTGMSLPGQKHEPPR